MTKKNFRILMVLALLSFLLLATPATTNILSITPSKTNRVAKVDNTASLSSSPYNVTIGSTLFYNITSILTNSTKTNVYPYMNITNNYNEPVGKLVAGYPLGFQFNAAGNNGTYGYVNGSVQSATLNQSIADQYFLMGPAAVLYIIQNGNNQGPPLLNFILPHSNFTQLALDYQNTPPFTVTSNNATTFAVSLFGSYNNNNIYLNVSWDKNTGIMQYYNQTEVSTGAAPLINALVLTFMENLSMPDFSPHFTAQNPGMFYNMKTLEVNSTNQLNLDNMNQSNTYGSFQQGQTALVALQAQLDSQYNPAVSGFISTLTGASEIGNPFNQSNDFQQGPPDMFFMLPVSSNTNWWGNVSLLFSVMGIQTISQNSSSITFFYTQFNNSNNNVTFTFNKVNGVMTYYNLQSVNAIKLPGSNKTVPLNMEFTFIKMYGLSQLYPHFGPLLNQQFRYHIDTLSIGGLPSSHADQGYFQQGQNIDILFNQLSILNGALSVTLSSKTGQSTSNVLYDLVRPWQSGESNLFKGSALFLPAIPVNSTNNWFSYLNDAFSKIVNASVVNNATTFGLQVTNMTVPGDIHVDHFTAYWNKSNGLMLSYDYAASSLVNSTTFKLKLSFVGNSNNQNLYSSTTSSSTTTTSPSTNSSTITSSGGFTTTAPGFGLVALFTVFICVAVLTRKRKHN